MKELTLPNGDVIIATQTAPNDNVAERNDNMRINRRNFELAIAKSCMTTHAIRKAGKLSNHVICRARHDNNYKPGLVTIGKLARALDVDVEYLVEEVN